MRNDQNLIFLKKFIELYEGLVCHDGYGDMSINTRIVNYNEKEIRLFCGKEYKFTVLMDREGSIMKKYRLIDAEAFDRGYFGKERRNARERRQDQRRKAQVPRNFKLERRINSDRRSGHGRRHDD